MTLGPVENVQAVADGSSVINVTWDQFFNDDSPPVAADGYEVEIDGGAPIDVGDVLEYQDTGIPPNTTRQYRVRGYFLPPVTLVHPIAWWDFEEATTETEYKSYDEDPAYTLISEEQMLSATNPKTGDRNIQHDGSSGTNADRDEFVPKPADPALLDFTDSFAFTGWVELTGTPPSDPNFASPILSKWKPETGRRVYWLRYDESKTEWVVRNSGNTQFAVSGPALPSSGYHFFACWWDKDRGKIGLQIGETEAEVDFTGTPRNDPAWPFALFFIGGTSGTWTSSNIGDHRADAVNVWPKYLTRAQRDLIRNGGAGHTLDSLFATFDLAVDSVVPAAGGGTGGATVKVYGKGFEAGATVSFGASAATNVNVLNSAVIECDTPAGTGTVDVTVTQGAESETLVGGFEYTLPGIEFDPTNMHSSITLSNGNLTATGNANSGGSGRTIGRRTTGKWYCEATLDSFSSAGSNGCGILGVIAPSVDLSGYFGGQSGTAAYWRISTTTGRKYFAGPGTDLGPAPSVDDTIMVAWDADAGRVWFGRNGTWLEGDPAAGTGASYEDAGLEGEHWFGTGPRNNGNAVTLNQTPTYTVPSGFSYITGDDE